MAERGTGKRERRGAGERWTERGEGGGERRGGRMMSEPAPTRVIHPVRFGSCSVENWSFLFGSVLVLVPCSPAPPSPFQMACSPVPPSPFQFAKRCQSIVSATETKPSPVCVVSVATRLPEVGAVQDGAKTKPAEQHSAVASMSQIYGPNPWPQPMTPTHGPLQWPLREKAFF